MNYFLAGRFALWCGLLTLLAFPPPFAGAQEPQPGIHLNTGRLDTTAPVTLRQAAAAVTRTASFAGQRAHLLQFTGPIQPDWHAALRQTGVQILNYLPDNAYLVYGDAAALARAQSLPAVRWHGAYRAEHKVHPRARQQLGDEFAIQLVADAAANAPTLALLDQLKLAPLRRHARFGSFINIVVRLRPADLDTLAAQPDVLSVQPYFPPQKHDERQNQILAGNLTGNSPSGPGYLAWLTSKGFAQSQFDASGFVVDVSDSGIDNGTTQPGHFALYPAGNTAATSRVVYNRLEGTPTWRSTLAGCDGHGNLNTHLIAGYDNLAGFPHQDAGGYAYGLGVCPFVRVGSSVIFDPDNSTNPDVPTLMAHAYRDGARISNNSWGDVSSGGEYNSDSQAYDAVVRDAQSNGSNQEMVIVFSAGNDGSAANTITPPGTAKNVITVGAAENVRSLATANGGNNTAGQDGCATFDTDANSANDIADFSSRGPCVDGRFKPDLVAPGTHIIGGAPQAFPPPAPTGTGEALACFLANGDGICGLHGSGTFGAVSNFFPVGQRFFVESSGTSHAAPAVSGACALLRQYFINQAWAPPSPAMTKAFLMNSARYLTGVSANDTLPSPNQGMGELDLGVAFDGTARVLRDQLPEDKFTATGQANSFTGTIIDTGKPFRVTLVWTDAPGSTMSGTALNNDLDLTVTVGGTAYKGNVFSGATSTTGGSADHLNNVESVFLPAGTTGNFTVTVTANNINSDGVPGDADLLDQDFALVIYNAGQSGLAITTTNPLPAGEVGAAYNGTLTGSGGTTPYTWTLTAGALPDGLTLNSDGTITGTPTSATTVSFTAQVTDSVAATATGSFNLTINSPPTITTTSPLPAGKLRTAYAAALQVANGTAPYTWTITAGSLPAGLSLSSAGAITGTPTAAGTSSFTAQVTDQAGLTATVLFGLPISTGLFTANPTITPAGGTSPDYVKVTLRCQTAKATIRYTTDGTEPTATSLQYRTALTLTNSGTLKAKAFHAGRDDSATASASYTITTPVITTAGGLVGGTIKQTYRQALQATCGAAPYRWTVVSGQLPAGLKLSSAGILSGKPTANGVATFTLKVTDARKGVAQQTFTVTVGTPVVN